MTRIARIRHGTGAILALLLSNQAGAQTTGGVLPLERPEFSGTIAETVENSTPDAPFSVRAPQGAPNIVLFMSDDVGFAMASTFGGPVPTPNFDRLAARGQSYNRFHTTGVCSPSRAALLTGRNHHNAATGVISDMPSNYPGYNAHIPRSTATIAEVLRLNGYNTAMFGKHHNVPPPEHTSAGPFDLWPTGLGFEYFYGFVSGETDQWHPVLHRGTDRLPDDPGPPQVLDRRLASDAIRWVHEQKLAAPEKPFFIYMAPGSTHGPHQAPADFIARFKGQFDAGWDAMRETIFRRQLASGIVPRGTRLTPRPDGIPAWGSLSPVQRAFAARSMEVAAAMLAYQDEQFGRLLDELDRMGVGDKTLVLSIIGDNGASGEGGPLGVFNQFASANGVEIGDNERQALIETLGGPHGTSNYPVGWAWAIGTPFRWTKQYPSMLGGIRDGMIMAWAGHVRQPGAMCAQFGHLVDVAPTLFQAARVRAPGIVNGIVQKPLDGESLLASLDSCEADRPRTQYFELQGKAGLYRDGWFASSDNGRKPWELAATLPSLSKWELYDLNRDFSQSTDVSAKHPELLTDMIAVWREEARRNNVFPINPGRMSSMVAAPAPPQRKVYDFWGKDIGLSVHPAGLGAPATFAGSFEVTADIVLSRPEASGVILAAGSASAGWSFFLEHGKPVFVYSRSTLPGDSFRIAAEGALSAGPASLSLRFSSPGAYKPATVEIHSGGQIVAKGSTGPTWIIPQEVGEMLDAGRDSGVPVTGYVTPGGALEGDIRHVRLSLD